MALSKQRKAPSRKKDAASCAGSAWQGAIQGQMDGHVYGWAVNMDDPQERVIVEVCLNARTVAVVVADVFRADLVNEERDGCHGFIAYVGLFEAGDPGTLTARVANAGVPLAGSLEVSDPEALPQVLTRHVFGDGGLTLLGVLVDSSAPYAVQQVFAFDGEKMVAQAKARLSLPLHRSAAGEGHGFALKLPNTYADGRLHTIRVVDERGRALNGSPVEVCCHEQGAKSLAHALGTGASDLLEALGESYEKLLPRALGVEFFDHWHRSFESLAEPAGHTAALAVLIHGPGDAKISQTSLQAQHVAPVLTVTAGKGPNGFKTALQKILKANARALLCVRAGDSLAPHALWSLTEPLKGPVQAVYADTLRDGATGQSRRPWFKPAWNSAYAFSTDHALDGLALDLTMVREHVARHGLPNNYAALAWGVLADILATPEGEGQKIAHLPRVLYGLGQPLGKVERHERLVAACTALARVEPGAELMALTSPAELPDDHSPRRLARPLARLSQRPKVSLIIPTRDQAELVDRCITSLRRYTPWESLEIILVDNNSVLPQTLDLFGRLQAQGVRVLSHPGAFNYSRINNAAVSVASGDVVGLINNDIEALHEGWLEEMLGHLMAPGVGAVGAKLLWPNGMVQHGGVLTGVGNVAGHFGNWLSDADEGDHSRNQVVQELSAVTAACLLVRKQDYETLGGLDEKAFPVAFNDVDFCLRLRQSGKKIVWTPFARLLHAESASRGAEDTPQKQARARREVENLRRRWNKVLRNDPAYHPSLSLDVRSEPFEALALPPRLRYARRADGNAAGT